MGLKTLSELTLIPFDMCCDATYIVNMIMI